MRPRIGEQVPGRAAASGDLGTVTAMTRPAARAGARVLVAGVSLRRTLGAVVEPAGGAGMAALLDPPDRLRTLSAAMPLSDGNADPTLRG